MSKTATQRVIEESVHPSRQFDAVVVGAGFSGLRMLHELRSLGLSAVVIEAGDDVGGTWWWNKYPGARTDTEAWYYCYSFSKEIIEEWNWSERFPPQEEVLCYLTFVADRLELRKDIEFKTRVESATYDETRNHWILTTDRGQDYQAKYFISASGALSQPFLPDFPGVDSFEGRSLLPSRWPDEDIDFSGKRVAIVGTGATGVQLTPILAQTAEHVTVFQRTPNYVLPARNHTLSKQHMQGIRSEYDLIWERAHKQAFGFGIEMIDRPLPSVTPEEAQRILEAGWETGGFRFLFHTFSDIFVDEATNEIVAEFVRNKIRTIVHDPVTAELLCPKGYPVGGKRPPLGHYYFEAFNRDNVSLVDVNTDAIQEITPTGIRTASQEHEFDVIIYATGFDAVTGALTSMDVRGRDNLSLAEAWKDGPRTYLGFGVEGFPNFLMIYGPQSIFANVPVVVELSVKWISKVLTYMEERGIDWMEPTTEAEVAYNQRLNDVLNQTVIPKGAAAGSWFFGNNIPGKALAPLFEFSGVAAYTELISQVAEDDFEGFTRSARAVAASVT